MAASTRKMRAAASAFSSLLSTSSSCVSPLATRSIAPSLRKTAKSGSTTRSRGSRKPLASAAAAVRCNSATTYINRGGSRLTSSFWSREPSKRQLPAAVQLLPGLRATQNVAPRGVGQGAGRVGTPINYAAFAQAACSKLGVHLGGLLQRDYEQAAIYASSCNCKTCYSWQAGKAFDLATWHTSRQNCTFASRKRALKIFCTQSLSASSPLY